MAKIIIIKDGLFHKVCKQVTGRRRSYCVPKGIFLHKKDALKRKMNLEKGKNIDTAINKGIKGGKK